jgi:hypothetical protein
MYRPGNLESGSLDGLANSLRVELDKLAMQFSQPSDYLSLKTLYAQPKRIFNGMVVMADGTTWNPGSGAGAYVYRAGAWRFLG